MVAYVRGLHGKVRCEFALHRDIPLINPGRTARVPILNARRAVDLPRLRPDSRVVVNRENLGHVVRQILAKSHGGLPEGCRSKAEAVPAYADPTGPGAIRCVAVLQAPTDPQHHLASELVSDAQPRAERIRIGGRELAVASTRPPPFEYRRAGQTPGARVRNGRPEHAGTVKRFLRRLLVVPPDAIVERQFARDLPGVLHVHRHGVLAVVGILCGADAGAIHQTQQVTGVGESDVITPYARSL